jgi:hypothetical protein
MATGKAVTVDGQDLRLAFDFVSVGAGLDASAYICLETGKIHWRSADAGLDDEDLPEDIEDETRYLAVPSQHDLGLGRRLALAFVAEELLDEYDTVAGFFRRRGAYARFKDLLDARGKLAAWYEFENQATDEALRDWCADHDIELAAAGPAS